MFETYSIDFEPFIYALASIDLETVTGLIAPIPLTIVSMFCLMLFLWLRRTRTLMNAAGESRMKDSLNWHGDKPKGRKAAPRRVTKR